MLLKRLRSIRLRWTRWSFLLVGLAGVVVIGAAFGIGFLVRRPKPVEPTTTTTTIAPPKAATTVSLMFYAVPFDKTRQKRAVDRLLAIFAEGGGQPNCTKDTIFSALADWKPQLDARTMDIQLLAYTDRLIAQLKPSDSYDHLAAKIQSLYEQNADFSGFPNQTRALGALDEGSGMFAAESGSEQMLMLMAPEKTAYKTEADMNADIASAGSILDKLSSRLTRTIVVGITLSDDEMALYDPSGDKVVAISGNDTDFMDKIEHSIDPVPSSTSTTTPTTSTSTSTPSTTTPSTSTSTTTPRTSTSTTTLPTIPTEPLTSTSTPQTSSSTASSTVPVEPTTEPVEPTSESTTVTIPTEPTSTASSTSTSTRQPTSTSTRSSTSVPATSTSTQQTTTQSEEPTTELPVETTPGQTSTSHIPTEGTSSSSSSSSTSTSTHVPTTSQTPEPSSEEPTTEGETSVSSTPSTSIPLTSTTTFIPTETSESSSTSSTTHVPTTHVPTTTVTSEGTTTGEETTESSTIPSTRSSHPSSTSVPSTSTRIPTEPTSESTVSSSSTHQPTSQSTTAFESTTQEETTESESSSSSTFTSTPSTSTTTLHTSTSTPIPTEPSEGSSSTVQPSTASTTPFVPTTTFEPTTSETEEPATEQPVSERVVLAFYNGPLAFETRYRRHRRSIEERPQEADLKTVIQGWSDRFDGGLELVLKPYGNVPGAASSARSVDEALAAVKDAFEHPPAMKGLNPSQASAARLVIDEAAAPDELRFRGPPPEAYRSDGDFERDTAELNRLFEQQGLLLREIMV